MKFSDKLPVIALIVAFAAGIFFWLRTNTKKIMNMAEYSLVSVKLHKLQLTSSVVKVSLLIKNPSDLALKINSYQVEILKNVNGVKESLAKTPVNSLSIPANASVVNDMLFTLPNSKLISLISGIITEGIEKQLKGKISLRVKAEILGQYIEKEIIY